MNEFKSFIKNPIGIIGLFVSFVYAIASLILGVGLSTLTIGERVAFIAFIIVLPFYVFYHFVQLVKGHHKKLYGPGDFQTDDGFLKTVGDVLNKVNVDIASEVGEPKKNVLNQEDYLKKKYMVDSRREFLFGATILYLLSNSKNNEEIKSAINLVGEENIHVLKIMDADLKKSLQDKNPETDHDINWDI